MRDEENRILTLTPECRNHRRRRTWRGCAQMQLSRKAVLDLKTRKFMSWYPAACSYRCLLARIYYPEETDTISPSFLINVMSMLVDVSINVKTVDIHIDCLTARTACLVCFISTVNGRNKKRKPWKTSTSSSHITNLKQSILETFDIYGKSKTTIILTHYYTYWAMIFQRLYI
jgi:hypothetical protein